MPERAVPSDRLPASNFDKTGNPLDEKGEKPDRHGEWLADDARIWWVYERLAKLDDDEKVKRWSGGLNNLALFATLFSGITTAFLIESQGDMKPNFSELAYRVQNATAHGRPYVEEPFIVPGQARLVNCLWITSLLLSLSTALIAVMGQDWVEMYVDKPVCNPRQWAEIRTFRLKGVYQWYMPGVIATAPVLLHASLFLFGIGLAVFISSDGITQNLCIALCAIVAFLYVVIMFSSVLWSSSPFRSPATMLLRRWFCARFQRTADDDSSLPENAVRCLTHRVDASRRWVQSRLSMHWATFDIALEICDSHVSNGHTAVFRRWSRRQDSNNGGSPTPTWATHDPETLAPVTEPHHAALSWLLNLLSRFQKTPKPILARFGHKVLNLTRLFARWFSAPFRRYGPPALSWILNFFAHLRTAWGRLRDNAHPDISNGWLDISETPLLGLVADSLSWLYSASSSPEVTQLVVAGLCDHVMGCQVAEHANARSLTLKICQYADGHWDHLNILDLSRYVIIHANMGWKNWPDRVKRRFKEVIDAETNISQDFLLALVHVTSGLQSEPLDLKFSWLQLDYIGSDLATFERLCGRIPDRTPITLSTVASTISQLRSDDWRFHVVVTLSVLMNKWRDALPLDLRPVEHALRAEEKTNKFCHSTADRPIDNILHFLIESFPRFAGGNALVSQSIRDLALSLAQTASDFEIHHTCLVAMFGDINRAITKAAWSDLPAREIQWALDRICSYISLDNCPVDLRPMLARMIARCIRPPFPLRTGSISTQVPLSYGHILYRIVKVMSSEGALPDELFRPVLEVGALANLSTFVREASSNTGHLGRQFLWFLASVATWIKQRSDGKARLELFELFIANPTRTSEGAVWNLVDAIEITLAAFKGGRGTLAVLACLPAVKDFMLALKPLREMFPEPKYTLWADISSKLVTHRHHFPYSSASIRKAIVDGTGINPEQLATETLSLGVGVAVQGDQSAPGGSAGTIAPTSVVAVPGTGTLAHPAPHIAWIAAGATPDDHI